jgi:hypothetical protein
MVEYLSKRRRIAPLSPDDEFFLVGCYGFRGWSGHAQFYQLRRIQNDDPLQNDHSFSFWAPLETGVWQPRRIFDALLAPFFGRY